MNNQFNVLKIKEDGTQLDVRVSFYNGKFSLDDVGVKPKGKRKFTYVCGTELTDRYDYRILDFEGRKKMKMKRMLEVASSELLNEALIDAWMAVKPMLEFE